jgi:hypothetical protein
LKKKATRSRKPGNKSPNTSGLAAPWRPGQSGNPRGSSKKQRRKKRLLEELLAALQGDHVAIDQILGSEPKVVDVGLPPGTAVDVPTEAKRLKEVTEILREIGVVK